MLSISVGRRRNWFRRRFGVQTLIAMLASRPSLLFDYNTGLTMRGSTSLDMSSLKVRVTAIIDFLTQPLPKSILTTHPNDLHLDFTIGDRTPEYWDEWWNWADEKRGGGKWLQLVGYQNEGKFGVFTPAHPMHDGENCSGIPPTLVRLIDNIKTLQLDRACQTFDANISKKLVILHLVIAHWP